MALNEAQIKSAIDTRLGAGSRGFGRALLVHIFDGAETAPLDPYKTRRPKFKAPLEVNGRATSNPSEETMSIIGKDEDVDMAFLFSRLELERKFPAVVYPAALWITSKDRIEKDGEVYRIIRVHATGEVKTGCTMVCALGKLLVKENPIGEA